MNSTFSLTSFFLIGSHYRSASNIAPVAYDYKNEQTKRNKEVDSDCYHVFEHLYSLLTLPLLLLLSPNSIVYDISTILTVSFVLFIGFNVIHQHCCIWLIVLLLLMGILWILLCWVELISERLFILIVPREVNLRPFNNRRQLVVINSMHTFRGLSFRFNLFEQRETEEGDCCGCSLFDHLSALTVLFKKFKLIIIIKIIFWRIYLRPKQQLKWPPSQITKFFNNGCKCN